MLELNNISVRAGKQALLEAPVSLTEGSGQAIVFFGRNGTGKTTLLRTIAGRNGLRAHDIQINGKNMQQSGIQSWSKLVCYISGHEVMSREVSTYEYLLSARLGFTSGLGLYSAYDKNITDRWIQEMNIGPLLDKKYVYLSDGEKQLVNITRAFVYETPLILLDEPTSNLDVPNKKHITALLHRYAIQENKLIVYTSHDYFITEKFCRKAWYINHHRQFTADAFERLNPVLRQDFGIG